MGAGAPGGLAAQVTPAGVRLFATQATGAGAPGSPAAVEAESPGTSPSAGMVGPEADREGGQPLGGVGWDVSMAECSFTEREGSVASVDMYVGPAAGAGEGQEAEQPVLLAQQQQQDAEAGQGQDAAAAAEAGSSGGGGWWWAPPAGSAISTAAVSGGVVLASCTGSKVGAAVVGGGLSSYSCTGPAVDGTFVGSARGTPTPVYSTSTYAVKRQRRSV